MKKAVRELMARNAQQVLGADLKEKSQFVLCWTQDGCETHADRTYRTGGTGQAISVASTYGVPVINMYNEHWVKLLSKFAQVTFPEEKVKQWLLQTTTTI